MSPYEYPLAVTRGRYLTEVGGHSDALEDNLIGINAESLRKNTKLTGGERILLDPFKKDEIVDSSTPKPLFTRDTFRVEPIDDFHDSRILSMSSEGRAVLPETVAEKLEVGEEIVLNAAIDRVREGWLADYIRERLKKELFY